MRRFNVRLVVGVLLLGAGILLLLQNLGIVGVVWDALWAVLFALAGVAFLSAFSSNRDYWWAAIPGFTFLALGALTGLQAVAPRSSSDWGGVLFLGGIGFGFAVVYLARPDHWWAVIPAGVLLTLAAVAGLSNMVSGESTGGVFFLGLALTFGAVYLLPTSGQRRTWALIPAAVFLALSLVVVATTQPMVGYLWPAILILAGIYLVYRALRSQRI